MAAQEVMRVALTALLVSLPLAGVAQQRPDANALDEAQRAALGDLFNRAKTAYESKNFLEAIAALRAAHTIFPEPNILYRIGDAYENLGDLAKAAEFYAQYVAAAPDATDAGLVRRRIADLERRAAELETKLEATKPERAALLLDTNPAGSMVRLDDRAVDGLTPVRVEVAPGMHNVELQRDGYQSVVREIRIDAGETISLVYQLERTMAEPPPAKPSVWPWVLAGAGAASMGAAAGFFVGSLAADSKVQTWDQERVQAFDAGLDVPDRPDGYNAAVRNRVLFRNTAFIAGGVGAAAIVGGVLWLVLRKPATESAHIRLQPDGLAFTF